MNFGVYIHIPFCRGKCDYCSFYSIPCPRDQGETRILLDGYLQALIKDIASNIPFHGAVVDSIYFGGGTPSLFGQNRISAVLRTLKEFFQVIPHAEMSIECNPSDIRVDALLPLIDVGINRVTVGIQSFHERLRKLIGRFPEPVKPDVLEQFFTIPGIVHGLDLMVGILGASDEELYGDLSSAIMLKPEHISVYLLTLEKGTSLADRMANDEEFQNLQRQQLACAIDYLADAGYHQYEISNYCISGFESKHNLKYWTFQPYLGFGAGAHGFTGENRYYNNQSVEEYIKSPCYVQDVRSVDAAMAEYLMTALRLIDGFSETSFWEIFQTDIPYHVKQALQALQHEKLLKCMQDGNSLRYALTKEGLFISDYVIYRCVESLL